MAAFFAIPLTVKAFFIAPFSSTVSGHGCICIHQVDHLVGVDRCQRFGALVATQEEKALHVAGVEPALLDA